MFQTETEVIPCMCVILYITVGHTLLWVGGSCIITLQLVGNRDCWRRKPQCMFVLKFVLTH